MSLVGKFELVSNEHFFEHLVALGIPEEKAKVVNALRPVLEVSLEGNKVTFTSHSGEYKHSSSLIFDQEVDEKIALNIDIKSIAKRKENKIEIYSKGPSGEQGSRIFDFSEKAMIMTLASAMDTIPVAKRYYKRLD